MDMRVYHPRIGRSVERRVASEARADRFGRRVRERCTRWFGQVVAFCGVWCLNIVESVRPCLKCIVVVSDDTITDAPVSIIVPID